MIVFPLTTILNLEPFQPWENFRFFPKYENQLAHRANAASSWDPVVQQHRVKNKSKTALTHTGALIKNL